MDKSDFWGWVTSYLWEPKFVPLGTEIRTFGNRIGWKPLPHKGWRGPYNTYSNYL